jgi:hypothetical protein
MKDRKVKQVPCGDGTSRRAESIRRERMRVSMWIYFVFVYKNRTMKPVEIVLRRRGGRR